MKAQERQLSLVAYLHHHRFGRTLEEIIEDIPAYGKGDAARKKLQRDRSLLREIGLPLHVVEQPGFSDDGNLRYAYVLDRRESFARSLRLSPAEGAQLLLLCDQLMAHPALAHAEWIQSARDKLLAAGLDAAPTEHISSRAAPPPLASPSEVETLERVMEALESSHCLSFSYQGLQHDEAQRRLVHPRQLCAWKGRWLLKGWCELRGGPRSFLLQRMREVTLSAQALDPSLPGEEHSRHLGWELGLGEGPMAVVELEAEVAPLARRQLEPLLPPDGLREGPEGRLRVEMPVEQPAFFYRWLLAWGRQARLCAPVELQMGLGLWLEGVA